MMMTVSDIGRLFGVTRQRAQQIIKSDDFPAAATEVMRNRVLTRLWDSRSVKAWAKKHRPGTNVE